MSGFVNQHEVLSALLRSSLKAFVMKVFYEVSPSSQYSDNWHIDLICQELEQMMNGVSRRLIINIPPRYMKSIICSVALPAFLLGHDPKTSIICVSYSDDLASKHANDCRKVMTSKWYQDLFPATTLSATRKSTFDFETTAGGGRFSTSVNGTLTGRGADWIIIDDPIKPADAMSDVLREKVNEWYRSTLYSRLNDKAEGKIMLIMQRLHENDMTGFLLETDKKFRLIELPVIAERDETWVFDNPISGERRVVQRRKGDLLHPEREGMETILELQEALGEFAFSGQYQQNPVPVSGGIVKKEWLRFYNEMPTDLKRIVLSWDTAGKDGPNNAYSACIILGVDYYEQYYFLESWRKRVSFPELVKSAAELFRTYKDYFKKRPEIVIEDASSGTQLIQVLQSDYALHPHAVRPHQDKAARMLGTSLLIEQGKILFPNCTRQWYLDFEKELTTFPKSRYKDQCDALSQAVDYLQQTEAVAEPRLIPRNDFYLAKGRCIYKTHPMRDPRKARYR